MIWVLLITTILASCDADVSHLNSNLQEDGYHYKKPVQPFPPPENNGLALDNQLDNDKQQHNSNELSPITTGSSPSESFKPILEYLPPDAIQPSPFPQSTLKQQEPDKEYGPPSTYRPPFQTQPLGEYGSPTISTTFAKDLQETPNTSGSPTQSSPSKTGLPSSVPQFTKSNFPTRPDSSVLMPSISSSSELVEPNKDYGSPPTLATKMKTSQPKLSSASTAPEREYLPPVENEIKSGPEQAYPPPYPSIRYPSTQPTEPIYTEGQPNNPEPTSTNVVPQPSYPAEESTLQLSDQSVPTVYQMAQPTTGGTEFTSPKVSPQNSYTEPHPMYPTGSDSQSGEPEPAHKLGPDGYEYKIPSKTFKY